MAQELKPVSELTYTQALKELEQTVATLQGDNCDIDAMVALTKRATELLATCRARLTATEEQLRETLAQLTQA